MYSSITSLYIALDSRLQLLNSNRKQNIRSEEYDIAINDAIYETLKQRYSAELNSKRIGFEESKKRYEDLSSLKKVHNCILEYNYNNEQSFILPSDFLYPICFSNVNIDYNKNNVAFNASLKDRYTQIIDLTNAHSLSNITFIFNDTESISITISGITKSNKSLFYTLNYISEYLKEKYNLNVYIENFENLYYKNSLIVVNDYRDFDKLIDSSNVPITTIDKKISTASIVGENISKQSNIDFVSSYDFENAKTDLFRISNLHLNSLAKQIKNKIIILKNPKFIFTNIDFEYIKKPRLVNGALNRMTDFSITDEVLDIATKNLSVILNNENYQSYLQKQQINN